MVQLVFRFVQPTTRSPSAMRTRSCRRALAYRFSPATSFVLPSSKGPVGVHHQDRARDTDPSTSGRIVQKRNLSSPENSSCTQKKAKVDATPQSSERTVRQIVSDSSQSRKVGSVDRKTTTVSNKPLTVTPLCTKRTNLAVSEGRQIENTPKRLTLVSERNRRLARHKDHNEVQARLS